jgi:hypothetical protein
MLDAIRRETSKRENENFEARSRGYCCRYKAEREELYKFASDSRCCEKDDPGDWELNYKMMEISAHLRETRLRKESAMR